MHHPARSLEGYRFLMTQTPLIPGNRSRIWPANREWSWSCGWVGIGCADLPSEIQSQGAGVE